MVKELGEIVARPREEAAAKKIAQREGVGVFIPKTGRRFIGSGRRGGGTPSRDRSKEANKREADIKATAEKKRQADLKIKQEKDARERAQKQLSEQREQNIIKEQNRIKRLEQRLQRENAQRTSRTFTDSKTGDKIQHDVIINRRNERIFTETNLNTGVSKTRTFEKSKRVGGKLQFSGVQETGSIVEQRTTQAQANKIQNDLASGDRLVYDTKNMKIIGINSSVLKQNIPWTTSGISFYNKQLGKLGGLASVQGVSVRKPIEVSASDVILVKGLLGLPNFNLWQRETINKVENWQPTSQFGRNIKATAGGIKFFSTNLFIHLPVALVKLSWGLGNKIGEFGLEKAMNPRQTLEQLRLARQTAFDYVKRKGSEVLKESDKITAENIFKLYLKNLQNQGVLNKVQVSFALKNYAKYINFNKLAIRKDVKKAVLEKAGSESFVRDVRRSGRVALNTFVVSTAVGVVNIPAGLVSIVNDPTSITKIPEAMVVGAKSNIALLKTSPAAGIGKIGSDIFIFWLTGKSIKFTGKFTNRAVLRLNPYFRRFKDGVITFKIPAEIFKRGGKEIFLKKRITKTTIINKVLGKVKKALPKDSKIFKRIKVRKKGQFRKFQKGKGIRLETGTIGKGVSLAEQTKFAGTKGTITTAQADGLIGFFRRNKLIRKPMRGEEGLSQLAKRLLKKFDDGTITQKEFFKLNELVLKQTGKSMLERSLYADPTGKVRFTRLGKDVRDASLMDIVRGNFTLKTAKPQIIVFPEGAIAKFPASLKSIVAKLKRGVTLSVKERAKLVRWQTTLSDKWKAIGDTLYKGGRELEVTLSPGAFIRRIKKLAVTEIDGIRVSIIEAKVIKLSSKAMKLLNKAKKTKLNIKEIAELRRLLRKETRLPVRTSDIVNLRKNIRRRPVTSKPFLPVGRIIGRRIVTASRRLTTFKGRKVRYTKQGRPYIRVNGRQRLIPRSKITPRKPTTRKPTPRKPTTPKRPPRTPGKRPPRVPRVPRRPTTTKKTPVIIAFPKGFNKKKLSTSQPVFRVVTKKRGKLVSLIAKPLIKKDALNYLAYKLDNTLSRTAFLIPLGSSKVVIRLPGKYNGYFAKIRNQLRPYSVKRGKKKVLTFGWIEKAKASISTRGEKLQLQRARQKARLRRRKLKSSIKRRKTVGKKNIKRKVIKRGVSLKKKVTRRSIKSKTKKKIQKPIKIKRRVPKLKKRTSRKPLKSKRTKKRKKSRKSPKKKKK